MMENNKGITLITLTIMIVVILILAAVGANHNSDSIKYAKLTKLTAEFEIINTQISILNQNKNYQTEYVDYGLDSTKDAELISKINTLLEEKLVNIYNIEELEVETYKKRFQYCSKENINANLGIEGIDGKYLVNIQNKIIISFDGIKYNGKMYYTIEELEKDGLASSTYKVQYTKHKNPYIPQGHYYAGGTWDTGYIIGDSLDDKYTGNGVKVLTTEMIEDYRGNLYMWIPTEEKSETNASGINWSSVTSDTDYDNIQLALDAYKTTYVAPSYSSEWYKTDNAEYAYKNTEGTLVKYPTETPTEADTNNLLSSIYLNGGLYIKIHDAKYVETPTKPNPNPQPGILPSGYQQVEYLESTGTQYIDTEYIPNENTSIEVKARLEKIDYTRDGALFGARNAYGSNDFVCWYNNYFSASDVSVNMVISGQEQKTESGFDSNFMAHKIMYSNSEFYVDNTLKGNYTKKIGNSGLPLYLLALNNNGKADARMFLGKLYYFKIWDNGTLVRNFIPCYKKSDNVAGMYDTVEGKFYTNLGTGNFLKGPHADGTTEVEYIQSSGTQYIDTGVVPTLETGFALDLTILDAINASGKRLFGSSYRNSGSWGGIMLTTYNSFEGGQLGYGTSTSFVNPKLVTNNRMQLSLINKHYTSSTGADINFEDTTLQPYGSMYILNINTDVSASTYSSARLYSVQIYNGETLIRDFIPVLDKNRVACLYDKVEGKYYYNQGTGTFSYK